MEQASITSKQASNEDECVCRTCGDHEEEDSLEMMMREKNEKLNRDGMECGWCLKCEDYCEVLIGQDPVCGGCEGKCPHCDGEMTEEFPSGGVDVICKDCYTHYCRPREEGEGLEDYLTRHPHESVLRETMEWERELLRGLHRHLACSEKQLKQLNEYEEVLG